MEKEQDMEYKKLRTSDLNISVVGFGAWGIGGAPFLNCLFFSSRLIFVSQRSDMIALRGIFQKSVDGFQNLFGD